MILEEFDMEQEAIINPWDIVGKETEVTGTMPQIAVTCFERNTFNRMVRALDGVKIAEPQNANGGFPIYKAEYKKVPIALYMSDMGAAGAGGLLEEVYALGVEKVIMFGACGVLDKTIEDCSIIIPNKAVRDEGLSYHYAPPGDEIDVNPKYMTEFVEMLNEMNVSYRIGKVWTTDAFYRETRKKMLKRKEQGCICVDMECSAMAAVAQFRKKDIFQFFNAADCLDGDVWDERSLSKDVKFSEKDGVAQLALEFAVRISKFCSF